jgi:hypothetical protein
MVRPMAQDATRERRAHGSIAVVSPHACRAVFTLASAVAVLACRPGLDSPGPTVPSPTPEDASAELPSEARGLPSASWRTWTPLERARVASARGDYEQAAREAWEARGTAGDGPELRALGAHAALAIDCADQAVELARDAHDVALLRVSMRAHLTRDRWDDAATIAGSAELAGDEEARSVIAVARAAAGRDLWQVSGAGCAEAMLRTDAPVPVVEVEIGGARLLALVDTTAHTTRLSLERAASDGVLDEMVIGGVTISGARRRLGHAKPEYPNAGA